MNLDTLVPFFPEQLQGPGNLLWYCIYTSAMKLPYALQPKKHNPPILYLFPFFMDKKLVLTSPCQFSTGTNPYHQTLLSP